MSNKKTENPMDAYDWEQDANGGFENTDAGDFKIPFLQLIQANSPELKKSEAKYIKDASQGDIFNTVTRTVLGGEDSPVEVIPCTHWKSYNEWRPKEMGGGLIQSHSDSAILRECTRDEKFHDMLPNGNEIVTTSYVACLVLDKDGGTSPALLTFKSTQLKKVSAWLTSMRAIKKKNKEGVSFTAPMFAYRWAISTVLEGNAKGEWYGWRIANAGPVEKMEHILEAKSAKEESVHLSAGTGASTLAIAETSSADAETSKPPVQEELDTGESDMSDEF